MDNKNETVKIDTNEFLNRIGEEMKTVGAQVLTFPTVFVKDPNSDLGISFNRVAENIFQIALSENDHILITEYFYWGLDNAVEAFLNRAKSTIESTAECKKCEQHKFQA